MGQDMKTESITNGGRSLPFMFLWLEPAALPYRSCLEPLQAHFELVEGNGASGPTVGQDNGGIFLLGVGEGCGAAELWALGDSGRIAGLVLCGPAGWPDLEQCQEIVVPALLLAGRQDGSAQGAERYQAALPNSQLVIFDGSGRFPFADEPEKFYRVIRDWLAIL